ncbi:MAG: hypothetical protein JWM16_1646 [Verrucomicrobiales bacterium]|nr:hypothetical protein [Verrucomicrobiales bacterium]
MSSPAIATNPSAPIAIGAKWGKLPLILLAVGGLLGAIGWASNPRQFGYSYLVAYMFFLSICLGGLFFSIIHHLFDANWTMPIRRVCEHLACLLPIMGLLFLPIAILAPTHIYSWMQNLSHPDAALAAKQPLFTLKGFYISALVIFAAWFWLSFRMRHWSLLQDKTGDPKCTYALRKHAAYGIFVFAFSLTLGAIMWMKSLEYQWFSTMYGVYYFAGSVWTTLATLYVITVVLQRTGPLNGVVHNRTFHDTGVLFFAFTVFYAYIAFSQYFLIWNAAMPEETFWYVQREKGSWWQVGMLMIFGHFLLPFLTMLRIDAKLTLPVMIPLCIWAWMMHFCDMSFNIMPVIHPDGFIIHWLDIACMAFIGGVLSFVFILYFKKHPPYPLKDPRMDEALGVHHSGGRPPIAAAD